MMRAKPELEPYNFKADDYELVVLCSPVWTGTFTPPFRTFLDDNNLTEKKVAVIASSTSGNGNKCIKQLKEASCTDKLVAELSLVNQYSRMAEGVTELMVNAFDGDKVDLYIEKNFDLPEYVKTVDYFYTLWDNFPDVLYMYIYRFEEDGGHVVIDLDADWWEDGEGYEPGYIWSLDMIDLMGGKITVESKKDCGTTFTVDIPLQRTEHVAVSDEKEQPVEKVLLEGIRVLVAEDMAVNAKILMKRLNMEGITSEWAKDGKLAVEAFANSKEGYFDAILMDMRMLEMDGLAATREIRKLDREDAKTIPVIALTANAFEEDVNHCIEAGMNVHMSKPVDIDLLKSNLSSLLSRH